MVKNLPAMQETQVWSLGWEDPLEKGKATHSSILAWRIPWTEEPGGLQSMGSQRVGYDWVTNTFTFLQLKLTTSQFSKGLFFPTLLLLIYPIIMLTKFPPWQHTGFYATWSQFGHAYFPISSSVVFKFLWELNCMCNYSYV